LAERGLILVTGATGYVGGRLVPHLLKEGYPVRVLVRDRLRIQGRPWTGQVEIVEGDVMQPSTLLPAMEGVSIAYYLIHSMRGGENFQESDQIAARNFGRAAEQSGIQRIIYLGGLGNPETHLSDHLRSRQQSGEALRSFGIPVTELRAGVIIGSGSLSFEMIRYLTERLPVMICPRWVFTRIQPIAIEDVIDYLIESLRIPESSGRIIEIGGADVITYGDMMTGYAKERRLTRFLLPVPVLTPRLSSYWVHWMTPIPAWIARPLIEGLRNEVIVRDNSAREIFPNIHPIDYQSAVVQALQKLESGDVETIWSDSLGSSQGNLPPVYLTQEQGMIIERRERVVYASANAVFATFCGLGGKRGWLTFNFAWRLRGMVDRLIGGVGFRRGRRHPDEVRVGDAIDFWRVEAVGPGTILRLRAEMKVPGLAWLQFEVHPLKEGYSQLIQTAFFAPKGLVGLIYWYSLYPFHALIFRGLVEKIQVIAESKSINTSILEF